MKSRLIIIIAAFLLFLNGCTGRDMAHINDSMKAESLFKSWPLPEQYEYYYYGTHLKPIAFLALDKKFSMESSFWTKIFPTIKLKEFWQGEISYMWLGHDSDFRGMEIITSDNRPAGYIYSRNYWVTAWSAEPGSNSIVIPPPEPSSSQDKGGLHSRGGGD